MKPLDAPTLIAVATLLGALPIPADELDALEAAADRPSPTELAEPADPRDRPLGDPDAKGGVSSDDPYNTGHPRLDSIWLLPLIYQDENNPIIQEFKIKGKYQWQNVEVNSDQGDEKLHENRRARLGATMRLLYNVEIEGEVSLTDEAVVDGGLGYGGIDTLYATVRVTEGINISVGKMKPKFTYEYTTDSAELPVLERSLLVEQLMPAKSTGVTINGETGNWGYEFGVYSGERSDNLSGFSDGVFYHARATYDFNDPENTDALDREFWHFDYIYNADEDINTAVSRFRHAVATGVYLENGPFSLAADVMYATGDTDAWGASIIPAIFLVEDKLQLVGRYHFADTDDDDGLVLRPRYEQLAPFLTSIRGDEYHSFYVGLNYLPYGNRLKLMTGLEFASMKDHSDFSSENYRGWSWLSGARVSF